MSAKKITKIAVVDEDEEISSKPKKKKSAKKVKASTSKTVRRKKTVPAVTKTKLTKKKIVTTAISEEDINLNDVSFADKLEKELGESPLEKATIQVEDTDDITDTTSTKPVKLTANEDEEIQAIVKNKVINNRSINIYRRIAYFFIFLVFILLLTSAYFLLTKVVITLVPDQQRMSNNLIFDVKDKDSDASVSRSSIKGVVKTMQIEYKKAYPASGSEVIGKEAIGQAIIFNNYSKSQMLVATTRLLSASGQLFRLKNTVNVPAGGSIKVEIYADEPTPEMAINPTKFNIPGLWAGLQDKIYAETKEKIVYQQKIKKHLIQKDIDNGIRDMRQQLLSKAKTEINKKYNDYDEVIYNIDDDSIQSSIDAEVGDEINEANITMSAKVVVVAFKGQEASALAKKKFITSLSDNKELVNFDQKNIIYSLNNYNDIDGVATINATFEGKISLKKDSSVIDKEKIIGLNKKQLEIYLDNLEDVSGHEIKFYPSFLPDFLKKVPRLPERINIKVKK